MKKLFSALCLIALISFLPLNTNKASANHDMPPKIMQTTSYSAPTQIQ